MFSRTAITIIDFLRSHLYILCLLLAVSDVAHANSYSTAEGSLARALARSAELYAVKHGHAPKSWSDFDPYLKMPNDALYRNIAPTKRYAFLSQPLHLPPPHKGDLLIITRRPFRELGRLYWPGVTIRSLREPGRYIIYRTSAGAFTSEYVSEAYVQQAFRGFESLLPTPDTEPERRHEREARVRSIVIWTLALLLVGALLAFVFLRRSSQSRDNGSHA